MGLVILFPLGLFVLVVFSLYFEITVDLQKSCKEHTYNFHIPLSQFPPIFCDHGTFVKTEKFNVDATLLTEYLFLFRQISPLMPLVCSRTQGLDPHCL